MTISQTNKKYPSMPSIQQFILYDVLRASSFIFGNSVVPKSIIRNLMNKSVSYLSLPKSFLSIKVNADGVPALWVQNKHFFHEDILFYLHGGGFHIGSSDTHKRLVYNIAMEGKTRGFLVDYRKAPQHRFPAPIEDSLTAYKYLLNMGYSSSQIIFAGDSAGGGLALSLLLKLKEEKIPMPKKVILLSPWVDHTGTSASFDKNKWKDPYVSKRAIDTWSRSYLGNNIDNKKNMISLLKIKEKKIKQRVDPKNPLVSPLFGDLTSLPPTLIQVGTKEVLYDDSIKLHDKLQSSKVKVKLEIYEDMIHVFQAFEGICPKATDAIRSMGAFIQEKE